MRNAIIGFSLLVLSCGHAQVPLPNAAAVATSESASVARGEYIVRSVSVCGSCHAADAHHDPDGPLSGGAEFRDWRIGIARASNLTPDAETGLGNWSEAEIVRAIRNGQRTDGRLLTPVMPYEWYHEMSDEDAFAVARYLKSLPPVRHEVQQSPSFALKAGRAFLRPKAAMTVATPSRADTNAYGSYLAQHVGLCGDCHTQRVGLMQKADHTRLFEGMTKPPKAFPKKPPNITGDSAHGIGKWSEEDFVRALRTGATPSGEKLHPFMPWPQLKRMTDDDLHAIYTYLQSLHPESR